MAPASGDRTILVTLAHKVEGIASFSAAVDKVLAAQRELTRKNRDYTNELNVLNGRIGVAIQRQHSLQSALDRSNVAFNTYATKLTQAQQRLTRYTAAYGSYEALLKRIADLEKKRDAALAAGKNKSAGGYTSVINQLQKVADIYHQLPAKIDAFDKAMAKENQTFNRLDAAMVLNIANIKKLEAEYQNLNRKQAVAGQPATGSTTGFWTNLAAALTQVSKLGPPASRAVSGVTESVTKLVGAGGFLRAVFDGLGQVFQFFGGVVQYALGTLLAGAIRDGISLVRDLGTAALETVRDFERLSLSLRAMTAKELQANDATLSINNALKAAAPIAVKTLHWLEQLAILSPFSLDDIKQAYLFGQAMGFTSQQAVRVTQAVVDWASATGRTGEQIERVIYALGQIRSAGRLVGQDILQLAQAGIGVDEILAKAFHKTTAEIRDMRINGLIPAGDALRIIIESLEKDWAGAAQDQARSISGLLNSFQDLSGFLTRDLLGPLNESTGKVEGVLGVLQENLGDLVDFLQSGGVRTAVREWGQQLGKMAESAFTWGKNLIRSFTNGIISGINDVIYALARIGQVITSYLIAHSPPKLLPDIDKWGRSALQAYMKGFSDLRSDSFTELEQKLEGFLRSLSVEVLPEINLVPTILNIREAVGKALAGEINLGDIIKSLGIAGESMSGYVTALFDLETANKAVADAQKNLDSVTEYYDKLLGDIEARLTRIDNSQQDLMDEQRKRMLGLILLDPNATLAEKEMARLEIQRINTEKELRMAKVEADEKTKAAKDELDAAEDKQDAAEEAFKLQERLIDSQIHTNELLKEYLDLLAEKDKKEAGGAANDIVQPEIPLAGIDVTSGPGKQKGSHFINPFKQALDELKRVWTETWAAIQEKLKPVEAAWNRLKDAWQKLKDAITDNMPEVETVIGELAAQLLIIVTTRASEFLDALTVGVTYLADVWKKHGPEITKFLGLLILMIIDVTLQVAIFVTKSLIGLAAFTVALIAFGATFLTWAQERWKDWNDLWKKVTDKLETARTEIGEKIKTFIADFKAEWWSGFAATATTVGFWLATIYIKVVNYLKDTYDKVVERLGEIKDEFNNRFTETRDQVNAIAQEIYDGVTGQIKSIITTLTSAETIQSFFDTGTKFVQGIIDGIASMATKLAQAIAAMVSGMFGTAEEEAENGSPSRRAAREVGRPIAQGVAMGLLRGAPLVQSAMRSLVGAAITPPARDFQMGSNQSVTNNNKTVNFSPTYYTNAPAPQYDLALAEVWAR